MSQEVLAALLGVTFQQVQKYEKGANRIAASRLWEMSAALDLPIAAFFQDLPGPAKSTEAAHGDAVCALTTPGATELLRVYASVKSARVRRSILDLVRALDQDNS